MEMLVKILTWWCLCLTIAFGFTNSDPKFPNPQTQFKACGRQKPSYVCDPEFVLELAEAEKLDQLVQGLKLSTSCLCPSCSDDSGVSVGIFIKNRIRNFRMEVASEFHKGIAIEDENDSHLNGKKLAETIRKEWNLGKCGDDIVIVLITELNVSDFNLGPSMQSVLPENIAAQIVNDCRIHFESRYFYQGLESIVNSFNDVIIKEQRKKNVNNNTDLYLGLSVGFAALLLLLICLLAVHMRQKRRRKRRCSTIYENDSIKQNRKNLPDDDKDQLEKLNKSPDSDQMEA